MSPSINVPPPGNPRPGDRTPVTQTRPASGTDRLEEKISSLASAISHWQSDLDSVASRSSRLEGAFTVLLTSLEGWKSDIREVASRTESRVLRGLEVIDSRISRVQPGAASTEGAVLEAIAGLEKGFNERIQMLENDIAGLGVSSGSTAGFEALNRRLQGIEKRIPAPDAALSGRLAASFEILERRLNSIEQRISAPPADGGLSGKMADAFEVMERRLQAIEQKIPKSDEGLAARISGSFDSLERRIKTIEQTVTAPDTEVPAKLAASFESLERRLSEIDQKVASPGGQIPPKLAEFLGNLESRLFESQQALTRKLEVVRSETDATSANQIRHLAAVEQQQSALIRRLESLADQAPEAAGSEQLDRLVEGQKRLEESIASADAENRQKIGAGLTALESRLNESRTALAAKLETVLSEADENNATQLRYLGTLEELQAGIAKRVQGLEAVISNPLDAKQWERLAKGLEFLDVRLAQSFEAVTNRIDNALGSLTSTLDGRTASGQEANLKSAERLWRALRGLEDQITSSYQLVRQSQERLEGATQNVGSALEELRAVHGARASHTEKLVMEGMENLDGRFAQNLLNISEQLGSAIFALNRATEEWRSDLANSTEESEERLSARVTQAEAKLAAELKKGLEALGRREERMLALILGGGAAAVPANRELDGPQ